MKLSEIGNEVMDRPQRIAIDHAIIERAVKMKLSSIGSAALDSLCGDAGDSERAGLDELLIGLPQTQRLAIDQAIGDYLVAVMESAFLAGLKAGANPLALLVDA